MKFNSAKLEQLHVAQAAGWRFLRDLSSAANFEHGKITRLEFDLSRHAGTTQAADMARRGVTLRPDLERDFNQLTAALAQAKREYASLSAEIERLRAQQESRGRLLESCMTFLRSRGIEPHLVDARPDYISPRVSPDIVA